MQEGCQQAHCGSEPSNVSLLVQQPTSWLTQQGLNQRLPELKSPSLLAGVVTDTYPLFRNGILSWDCLQQNGTGLSELGGHFQPYVLQYT